MPITNTANQSLGALLNLGGRRPPVQEGQGFQQVMDRNMARSQAAPEPRAQTERPRPERDKPDLAQADPHEPEPSAAAVDPAQPVSEMPSEQPERETLTDGDRQDPVSETAAEPVDQTRHAAPAPLNDVAPELQASSPLLTTGSANLSPALTAGASAAAATNPLIWSAPAKDQAPLQLSALVPGSVAAPIPAPDGLLSAPAINLPLAQLASGQPVQLAVGLTSTAQMDNQFGVPLAPVSVAAQLADALPAGELDLEGLGLQQLQEGGQNAKAGASAAAVETTGLNGRILQASAALNGMPVNPQALEISRAEVRPGAEAPLTLSPLASQARPGAAEGARPAPVTVPVSQPNWAQATGERVLWMVHQKVQSAEIQLDPPELGPLQVRVSVHQDQVSVSFVSAHGQVRDALDMQSLRLREMFEAQGLNLVDVDVSDQGFQGNQSDSRDNPLLTGAGAAEEPVLLAETPLNSDRLVDQFV